MLCATVGGGFFTGRYRSLQDSVEPGSRFDPNKGMGKVRPRGLRLSCQWSPPFSPPAHSDEPMQNYRARYWNEPYFNALAKIEAVAEKYNLTMAEIALRWISHHSLMKREHGDAVLIGASSLQHIEQVRDMPLKAVDERIEYDDDLLC